MFLFKYLIFTTSVVLIGLTLSSCTPIVAKRGHAIDDDQYAAIRVGESTREDVAKILGTPTQMSTFDDKTWYYISRRTEQEAFFDPDLKEQKIITVEFTPEGKVASLTKTGAEQARVINPSTDQTPTYGKEITVIQQLLGNLGKPTIPKGKGN
jgi:outer membrane protein assembly factor BamE (lipoprotein component of BamABCDE complex)